MDRRRLGVGLALLSVLAAALAGCTQAPPPAEPETEAPSEEPAQPGLVPTGEVANFSQPEDQSDFAKSLDEKFHTHNYWGGSLEKLLMDQDVASSDALGPTDPSLVFAVGRSLGRGVGFTPFELPEGSIVPPETERLEIAITWASSPTITGLRLGYITAENENFTALDPLPDGGGTYTLETTLIQNDMPHTTVSKWRFFLMPEGALDWMPGVFNGTVHVAVKAHRSDALYVAPPHPDFWGDQATLELFNASGPMKGQRAVVPVPLGWATNEADSGFLFLELPNGTIVPPHTGLLTVTLAWQNNATLPDPFGIRPDLLFSPANTRGFRAPEGAQVQDGLAVYTIAVDSKMVDSPYANESSWAFLLVLTSDAPTSGALGPFGDVGFFDGSFALTVVADREHLVP